MIAFVALATAAPPLPACASSTDPDQLQASAQLRGLVEQAAAGESTLKSRLKQLKKLSKRICTAEDHVHAGWVLLGSRDPKDLERAYTLGQLAAYHHAPQAQALVVRAYDQWQVAQGAPQRYGTQTGADGACFWPVEPGFPDAQREAWGAAPLATSIGAFLKRAGREGEPPTEATLLRYQLLCDPG